MQALFALLSLKFFQKAIGMSHVIEKFNSSTMYQLPINYQLHSKQDSDFSLLKPLKVYKYIDIKVCLMLSYCTS